MPFSPQYNDLNRRCRAAIEEAERAAHELSYFGAADYTDPVARIDPARLADMRRSLPATLAGLTDPDPAVRLAALSLFGVTLPPEYVATQLPGLRQPDYGFPSEAADAMFTIATSDPDDEIRQRAIGLVPWFFQGERRDRTVEKRLAEIALETDNVMTRYLVFLGLMKMSGIPHSLLMSPKYLGLPIVFDEFYVRLFLEPDTFPVPAPVAPPPRRWWQFGKR